MGVLLHQYFYNQTIKYKEMEAYKERLIKEQEDLKEKLASLIEFINSDKFYGLSSNNR